MIKNKTTKRYINSPVLRNILTLFAGGGISQLITLAFTPIISRLFSPDDFGVAALLLAIAGILAPLATLSYSTAIQLPKNDADAARLLHVTLVLAFAFSLILAFCIFLYSHSPHSGVLAKFKGWEWVLPFLVLLYGIETALDALLTRMKKFRIQAATHVSGTAVAGGSRVFFGLVAGSSIGGLVLGYLLARITRVASLARNSNLARFAQTSAQNPGSYKSLILEYRNFPLFATPTLLLHAGNKNLPLLFFGTLFSPAAAGFYAMANRLFFRPFQLLQFSFRRVYTQRMITAVHREERTAPLLLKACALTASALAIPSLLLYLYGEPGISFVLGDRWSEAGVFLEISAPLLFLASVAVPANGALVALRQERRLLLFEILTTVILAAALSISFLVWRDPRASLYAIVAVLSVRHVSMLTLALSISHKHDESLQHVQ